MDKEKYDINSTISERITEILAFAGENKNSFAKKLGYDRAQTVYDVINGKSSPSFDFLRKFQMSEFSEIINIEWLLTGKGDMIKSDNTKEENLRIIHNPVYSDKLIEDQEVFLYDIYAAANLKTLFLNKDQNILGKISIPNIPACDGAVYINGDSMYPLLKSGDIIAYKEIKSIENIIYGEMYLISFDMDGDEFLTVKYINKSDVDGCIKLVSYNSHHDPKDIPLKAINALGLVKLSIRKNTMI